MLKTLPLSACLLACDIGPAPAACTQADLAGTWTAYTVSQPNNQALAWVTCSLAISKVGAFTTGTSSCLNSNGVTAKPQGTIKLSKAASCAFSGSINYPAFGVGGTIQSVTLTMNKQAGSGIGTGSSGVFVFSMVKVK